MNNWREHHDKLAAKAEAEGRTFFTGRCNCYNDHGSSSGRCYEGQSWGLWTLPERKGVCNHCWEHCGHRAEATQQETRR